jgi:hypothetical protein
MNRAKIFGISLPLLVLATAAHAGTFTFQTAAGATESGGGAVDASATVTTNAGAGTVTVQLFNLLVNPTDVAQLISDFDFTLTGVTGGTLSSSSGQEITVNSGGTSTLGSGTVSTGWALSGSGSYVLNALGAVGPAHLIIGPPGAGGLYSNANGSIAGNGPHNPFLNQSATFTIGGLTGLTADTTVSGVVFSFGTTAGDNVPVGSGPSSTVPEPVSLSLVGGGLLALGLLRKRLPGK